MLLRLPSSINPRKYTPLHLRCSARTNAPSNSSPANASSRPRTFPNRLSESPTTDAMLASPADVMSTRDSPAHPTLLQQLTEQY